MAKCAYCGADAAIFVWNIPRCVACDDRFEQAKAKGEPEPKPSQRAPNTGLENLEVATGRPFAGRPVQTVLKPSGLG